MQTVLGLGGAIGFEFSEIDYDIEHSQEISDICLGLLAKMTQVPVEKIISVIEEKTVTEPQSRCSGSHFQRKGSNPDYSGKSGHLLSFTRWLG